jgi:hypothetical protein
MPTIKITAEGKVITKGGIPSCTCCYCGCDGLWGPGYDSLPETVQVRLFYPSEGSATTWIRTGKCVWESQDPYFPGQLGLSNYCVFWETSNSFTGGVGYKDGNFDDGPTGDYLYFGGSGIEFVVRVE